MIHGLTRCVRQPSGRTWYGAEPSATRPSGTLWRGVRRGGCGGRWWPDAGGRRRCRPRPARHKVGLAGGVDPLALGAVSAGCRVWVACSVGMRWTAEQVLELAPDPESARAAGGVAGSGGWESTGATGDAVWGSFQGSGKAAYQVGVDLVGPRFRCSCPSRKVPCKHVLGLLLRWATGSVWEGAEPDWLSVWMDQRPPEPEEKKEPDEAAVRRRQARRADRVAAGVAELDGWLADQVR